MHFDTKNKIQRKYFWYIFEYFKNEFIFMALLWRIVWHVFNIKLSQ